MNMTAGFFHKGNGLFRVMIVLSVLIHAGVFVYLSGIYKKASLIILEVAVEDEFKPKSRAIPRPRPRPKIPDITDVPQPIANVQDMNIEPERPDASREIMETVSVPSVQSSMVEGLSGVFAADTKGLLTKNDYFDLVRMRIESAKIYPENARKSMVEGKVTVRFTVTMDGHVSSVQVASSSGNRQLDQAAVQAVNDASPFSRPPVSLFKGPLKMEITIAFELT